MPETSSVLGVDRRAWNNALLTLSRWRLVGEERDPLTIIRALARQIDTSIPEATIRAATDVRIERFRQALMRIPDQNLAALKQLRAAGYRLGLISNADSMEVAAWKQCPAAQLFDVAIFSCDVGLVKPEPEIYQLCLELLGLDAGECLFVGDGGSDELQGAKSVGMPVAFVHGIIDDLWPDRVASHSARREVANYTVRFIPELLNVLVRVV